MCKKDMARLIFIQFTPEDVNHAFTLEVFGDNQNHSQKYYFDRDEEQEIETIGLVLEQGVVTEVLVCPPDE